MQKVIGIKFNNLAKVYFFDPNGIDFLVGDKVLVETAVGQSLGVVSIKEREVDETEFENPIKKVIRKATSKDIEIEKQNSEKSLKALKVVKNQAKKLNLQMKIVCAEYTFDSSKVVIDFTAEERVDFRELLKILASELKARIELRQIGQRDEVKIKGGIGPCGEICCCSRFLTDFEHVTVKMAKNQGLSLSPTKISGLCGRLMCCLGYENPNYEEVLSRMPKINSWVKTQSGKGQVVYNDILRERVSVKIAQGEESFVVEDYALAEIETIKPDDKNQSYNKSNQKK